jgi:hypothetical protein
VLTSLAWNTKDEIVIDITTENRRFTFTTSSVSKTVENLNFVLVMKDEFYNICFNMLE